MSPLRTRASLALAAAAAMALAACSGSSSSDNPRGNGSTSAGTDSITVYSGRSEALVAPLSDELDRWHAELALHDAANLP